MAKVTRHNRMLGIAVGERAMLIAEVHAGASGSGAPRVVRTAEFRFPEGAALKDAEPLGEALGRFIKEQGFGARQAVFGIPARWVLSKQKEVPTADARLLADTLRLQAQTEFSPELSDLVYDYSGSAENGALGNSVLLLAVPRKYLDQLSQLADRGGLKVRAVMPFGAALAAATARPGRDLQMLLLAPWGVEYTAQHGGQPSVMRYVGAAAAEPSPLMVGELRRISTQTTANGNVANGSRREMLVWNDAGYSDAPFLAMGDALGASIRSGAMRDLGVDGGNDGDTDRRDYASAVSLAVAGMSGRPMPVDFIHSRLEAPPEQRLDRRTILAIAAAAAILLGTAWWWYDLHSKQADIDAQQAQYDSPERVKAREATQKDVQKIEFARGWHAENARFIPCLNDLTAAAPDTGDLYGTILSLKEDKGFLSGTLSGKSRSDQAIFKLRDRLKNPGPQAGKFTNLDLKSTEAKVEPKSGNKEITFQILFTYVPPPPPLAPAAPRAAK